MQPLAGCNATFRMPINRETSGCHNLVQRVFRYETGTSPQMLNEHSDDVVYVASGSGEAKVGDERYALTTATGLLVPAGVPYSFHNDGPDVLELVSVVSPQPEFPGSIEPSPETQPPGKLTVHESEEEELPAGEDRYFKLMIDPRYGSKYVTQFVGFIDKSHAPNHTHTYEEAIYILSGEGIVHIEGSQYSISAGSSVYLPYGVSHCLENAGSEKLTLLGVFCPAGSPAKKRE